MTSPVSFFKAFFGTCSGRDIFYALRLNSWGRCIWHLLILSIITAFITAYAEQRRTAGLFEAAKLSFINSFGSSICVDKQSSAWNWVCPAAAPTLPREIPMPNGGRFYYTGLSRSVPESLKTVSGMVLVWTPEALTLALPLSGGSYDVATVSRYGTMNRAEGSMELVRKVFRNAPEKFSVPPEKLRQESVNDIWDGVSLLLGFCLKFGLTLRNFLLVWLYTLIFMGMYRLLNGPTGRLRFLTLKEMWKCGIYASFPPMVIASLFPILDLPFVTYETVFMIALLIYWMAVIARLERPPFENEESDQYE